MDEPIHYAIQNPLVYTPKQLALIRYKNEYWAPDAACQDDPVYLEDPTTREDRRRVILHMKEVCRNVCPVRAQCLQHALQFPENDGFWGGYTHYERKQMGRQRGTIQA